MGSGEGSTIRIIIGCTVHLILVRVIKYRILSCAGHVARLEEGRGAFKILTRTPTGKRYLGRPRRRWEEIYCPKPMELVS